MEAKINTIGDLQAYRASLKNQLELTKVGMKNEVSAIKEELNPARQAVGFVKDVFTRPKKGLLYAGVGLGVDLLLKRGILRRAGWLPRLVLPMLVTNFASKKIQSNSDDIIVSGLKWVKKATEKK